MEERQEQHDPPATPPPSERPPWRQPELYVALLSALVLLAAAVLIVEWRSQSTATDDPPVVEVGAPAPDFSLPLRGGGSWSLADYRGRPIWINLWATWCVPCRVEFPEIDALYRSAGDGRLEFIAVNFQESEEAIQTFLENTGYSFPVALDPDGEFARTYGVDGLPAHIFIAEDGTVQTLRIGGMPRAEMERELEQLLGRPAGS